jgi:beta-mannosidase
MAASPDEGDVHGYPQWDASEAWKKILPGGPFISEWGSHGMPTAQTYREIVGPDESNAVIGPTLLKMDRKLMIEKYPEIAHHWVEFQPNRLIQMLARGSAFDDLATVPLGRFSEAVAAGAGEFYKYSCEASRAAYPQNSGMLLWVWKRPWPIVGIQLVDGMGRPLAVYYEVKRAYSSPWPCLEPPQLNYAVGEQVSMPVRILAEAAASAPKGLKVTVRLVGPDLKNRKLWNDFPLLDVPDGSESVMGPTISFKVADDFARSFFFVLVEIEGADGQPPVRNVYTFRCPPQMEDESFRKQYRAKADKALFIDKGPWLRPQLLKSPTTLSCKLVSATKENDTRFILVADVKNTGDHPAVMTSVEVPGSVCVVADDAGFWMEPGESRRVHLRVRCAKDTPAAALTVEGCAWNVSDSTL